MQNDVNELRKQDAPIQVWLYTCIPEKEEFARRCYPFLDRAKAVLRNSLNKFCTSLGGKLRFDSYSYMIANGLGDNSNRGDIAIRMAVKSQLRSAFAPRQLRFTEVGWGQLTDENIERCNQHAELFVIAGGGYIFVNGDGTPGTMLADSSSLAKLICPVVAFAIGLNRLMHEATCKLSELPPVTQEKVKQLSNVCKKIGVRDQDTAELFARYGDKPVTITGDPVLYFSESDTPVLACSNALKIGINLAAHGWRAYSVLEPLLPHIVENLKRLQREHEIEVVYFLHHQFERPIVEFLRKQKLRLTVIDSSVDDLIEAYNKVDFVINQMLHSCIFAANAGVPFLNLAYDRKSVAFCSLLDVPECVMEHTSVGGEALAERIEYLLANKFDLAKRISDKRGSLRIDSQDFLRDIVELV